MHTGASDIWVGGVTHSVIIPTKGIGGDLDKCLQALQHQDISCEVVVISSGADALAEGVARRYGARWEQIDPNSFDHGGTRNVGGDLATGQILVFLTQDVVCQGTTTLRELTKPIVSEVADMTWGRQVAPTSGPSGDRCYMEFRYPDSHGLPGSAQFSSAFCAVSRAAWVRFGKFPENVPSGEDAIFASSARAQGACLQYCPSAIAMHPRAAGWAARAARYFDMGAASVDPRMRHAPRELATSWVKYAWGTFLRSPLAVLEACAYLCWGLLWFRLGSQYRRLPPRVVRKVAGNKAFWFRYFSRASEAS